MVTGVFGAHRLCLGSRYWWVYPLVAMPSIAFAFSAREWFREPAFFVFVLVALVGALEAILFCLTPDERWDQRHNIGSGRRSNSGVGTVMIAIAALMLGAVALLSVMAIALEGVFTAVGGR
ncbi:MAG: hypothetical protein R3E48_05720 [Burkholderiaceae bacterium]